MSRDPINRSLRDPCMTYGPTDRRHWTLDDHIAVIDRALSLPVKEIALELSAWRNYAEAAWLGAPVKHVADWEDHKRVKRIYEQARNAARLRDGRI